MKKSIQINMFINLIRTFFQIVFPLLIFKYITGVLSPDSIGKINFSNSIVSYFIIIANLGISSYATRECAKIRVCKSSLNKIASELFTLGIISCIISYLLLFVSLLIFNNISKYNVLIIIQSTVIIFNAIGTDWVNIVFEDYLYIALRTIIIQIISFILILCFVKNSNDYILYVLITAFSSILVNILNYFHVRKYVDLKLIITKNIQKHIKPILVIFSINITVTIFVNSDITLLGILASETAVALYSIPVKIYSAIKTMIVAITSVSIPRLSFNFDNNKKEYYSNLQMTIESLLFFSIPAVVMLNCIPGNVIIILSNDYYLSTIPMLRILSFAIIPTMLSTIINNNIFLSERKERYSLIGSIVASLINIILNIIFIPIFGTIIASITTLISELVVLGMSIYYSRHTIGKLNFSDMYIDLKKIIYGTFFIMCIHYILSLYLDMNLILSVIYIVISIVGYILIEYKLHHKLVVNIIQPIIEKIKC